MSPFEVGHYNKSGDLRPFVVLPYQRSPGGDATPVVMQSPGLPGTFDGFLPPTGSMYVDTVTELLWVFTGKGNSDGWGYIRMDQT